MRNSYKKYVCFIVSVILVLSGFSFSALAVDEDTTSSIDIVVTPDETSEETTKKTETTKKPSTTREPTTEKKTTVKQPDNDDDDDDDNEPVYNNNNNDNVVKTTATETTEETLPEGSFYVYLEYNNGEKRQKHIMDGPGLLPEPDDEPVRKGYKFIGWYSDSKFTKEWDFFSDKTDKTVVLYAKWAADLSTVVHKISVKPVSGGTIEVKPTSAATGEIVTITVTPEKGKRLKSGSITINGVSTDFLSFEMIGEDVVVAVEFENIPATEAGTNSSLMKIVAAVIGVLAVVVIVAAIFTIRRRNIIKSIEAEETEEWIDDSIVVKDGFDGDGNKVKEPTEPDNNIGD